MSQDQILASVRRKEVKTSDVKEFLSWRAKTTLLLTPRIDSKCVQSHIKKVVVDISKKLRPLVASERSSIWEELQEIVEKAVKLDLEIRKSRAIFDFTIPCDNETGNAYGFPYDKDSIANQEGFPEEKNGITVDLIVVPFLLKTGNADGNAYEIQTVLSKCVGISTETRRKLSAMVL